MNREQIHEMGKAIEALQRVVKLTVIVEDLEPVATLEALMGPAKVNPGPWTWGRVSLDQSYWIQTPIGIRSVKTRKDVIGVINEDLASLAGGRGILWIEERLADLYLFSKKGRACQIRGDLGSLLEEHLAKSKPSELERMLTALMGPAATTPTPWSWCNGAINLDREIAFWESADEPWTPAEALEVINTRLADLVSSTWKLQISRSLRTGIWWLEAHHESNTALPSLARPINADLAACVSEVLKGIAEREQTKVEPKPSELETMLTALMAEHCPHPQPWRWCKQQDNYYLYVPKHDDGLVCLGLRGRASRVKYGVHESLQAINARLAELAPKGWLLKLLSPTEISATHNQRWRLVWRRTSVDECEAREVNADLGARIDEALKWIAAQIPSTAQIPGSALEKMLMKLMGPANDGLVLWSWHSIRNGAVITPEGLTKYFAVWGVDDAIRWINVRLKALSPDGWIVELNLAGDRPILSARRRSGGVYRCTDYPIAGNLKWCVEQAIAWCKAWHDFEGVKQ